MNISYHNNGEEYQSIFENATEGIFQSSVEGRFLKVNPAMARIFGYASPDEMIQSISDITNDIHVDGETRKYFIEELSKHERVEGFEARTYRKDRSIIWTRTNARTVRDEAGNILYFEGFLTDITLRKEAEISLRESEERYRALVERLPGIVFLDAPDDSESTYYVSPKIEAILGYSPEEWISKVTWSGIIHPDDRERVLGESKRTDKTKELFRQEYRIQKKDGEYAWIREEAHLVKDKHETPLFWQGFFVDISEQKQAEIAIRQSEEQFKKIFQANPIASCIATLKDGRFIAANDAYWKLSGFKPDEFLGRTSIELGFITKERRKKIVARLKKEKSIQNENGKLLTKSGDTRNTLEFFELIHFDGQDCILSMFYDMTDQVKAQDALQDNEEKYRQLFEAESDAIFLIDNESGNILEANAAATALYGYSKEELLHKKNSDLSAEQEETRGVTRNTPIDKNQIISIPIRYHRKKDGTIFPVEITGRFFEWRGRPVHIAAIRDITERKKIEEALRASDERFRLSFQTSPDSININRLENGLYIDVNEGFTAITGYAREEVIGKTSFEINIWDNPEDRAKLVKGLKNNGYVNNLEAKFRMKDGRVLTGLMSARVIMLNEAPHIISITREIETLKQTEETLQRQLKELSILHNVALAASSSKSVDELVQRVTDTISDTLHPDNCGVGLLSEHGNMLVPHASYWGASGDKSRRRMLTSRGVTSKVASTGIPIRLGDVSQEPAYVETMHGVQSELCVPIKIQDRVIGVINIESKKPDAFSETDERLLNTIAGSTAAAIEQLRLFETSQRRLQELAILNAVSFASTNAASVDELIEKVTQIIGESLYPDNFGVLLLNEGDDTLYPHPSYRGITDGKHPMSVPLGHGVSGQVAATGEPLRIANTRNFKSYIEVTSQVRSELCVPIAQGERILGVINAESLKIDAFTNDDERLLATIASTLATAIEKLRLLEAEQKRRQEAETLLGATNTLTRSLHLDTLLNSILETLSRIVPYDSASIAMQQGEELIIVAGRGFPPGYEVIGRKLGYSEKWLLLRATHQPFIVPDVQLEPSFEQWEGSEYIQGWMGIPMVIHDKLIGFINLDSRKPNTFTEDDAIIAQTFANSAAVAVENARLFEAERQSRENAEALREATAALTTSLELEALYETILDSLKKLLPFDSASIEILDQGYSEIVAGRGLRENQICIGQQYPYNAAIWEDFELHRWPIIIPDVREDKRFVKLEGTEYIRGWMGVPMFAQDRLVGFLNLDSSIENFFTDSHASLAQIFGNQAAIAIENARLFEAEQRRHRESETLRQAALAINTSLELESVLETLLLVMKQVIPYDSASVLLQEGDELRLAATQGFLTSELLVDLKFPAHDKLYEEIKKNKQPLILEDAQKDERFKKWGAAQETRGWMGIPLVERGNVIGCITIDNYQPNAYNTNSVTLALTFAHQASTAIRNARQFETEQRHFEEAETLRQTAEAITSSLDIRNVLNAILNNLSRVVPYDSAAILLIEGDKVRITAGEGFPDNENAVGLLFPASNALLQELWDTGKPLILGDAQADPRFEKWAAADQVRGWMSVPLSVRGVMLGCITIDSYKPEAYNEHDANLAMTFAYQAAAAIENARLYERSEQQIRQLTVLRDIDTAISSSFDLQVTLDFLISHAIKELNVDAAAILVYNPDLQALSLHSSNGFIDNRKKQSAFIRIGDGLAGQVALSRKLVHVPDLSNSPENKNSSVFEESFKSYLGVPLIGKGEIKGVLEVYSRAEIDPSSDWLNFLHTLAGQAAIAIDNVQLFKNLQHSNQELMLAYDTTLAGWGRALELRDKETQGHTNRVVKLTIELARRMDIEGERLTHIMRGALLHDIGKMGIPDHILNKPGPLTEAEWEIMRQHPQFAFDLMNPIPYLRPALEIPYGHHERWDGSGYPLGLKGKEIPVAARIFAVVDIWDALHYERVYRDAWPEEKVLEYLKKTAGIELDPAIVEKFLELLEDERYENQAE
ncbi:MAG: GAF domain-containing protein [Anaerolineales bacterium]|nr:GAF domain-containing protein [Anaerolineales bacterium]